MKKMKIKIKKKVKYMLLLLSLCVYSNSNAMSLEEYISTYNPQEAERIASAIIDSSRRHHLDPKFVTAVFELESGFHNNVVSSAGALGIAQLMPDTANYLNADPYNIESNIDGGVRYLKEMKDLWSDKGIYVYNYALASYNAGSGNVANGIPSYTYDYINTVHALYEKIDRTVTVESVPNNNAVYTKKILLSKLKKLRERRTK